MPTRGQLAWDQVETRIGALVERLERLEEQVKDQSAHRVEERPRQDRDSRADEQEIDTLRLQLVQSRETVNLLLNRLDQAPQQPQTSDALKTHQEISRRSLAQRENFLTCPISLDLFDDPVTTNCCGKTFSSAALLEALARNPACPICRADRVSVVPNRDIAALVELHKSESAVLGVTETETMGDHSNNEDRMKRGILVMSSQMTILLQGLLLYFYMVLQLQVLDNNSEQIDELHVARV
ncbi:hypothetical protein PHYBOEH_003273 [Phytophthora boehmeriae]|uniref:SP-RING-type domain-containing protein n=1 Tax=Phytophthora boehmeriae TaxID=109152 RepID=A0A8T1WV50_9STRA|nr:hypothetical protein PHYBOEH_003273 [Phytophthora boehmeriae]